MVESPSREGHGGGTGESFDASLPDASRGGDRRSLRSAAGDREYLLAVLLCDHYCPDGRDVVRGLAAAHDAFAGHATALVAVLPESVDRAAVWHRRYDLPFPILVDAPPDSVGEGRFDAFAPVERRLDSLPGAALFAVDEQSLRLVDTFDGAGGRAVPAADALLAAVEDAAGAGTAYRSNGDGDGDGDETDG